MSKVYNCYFCSPFIHPCYFLIPASAVFHLFVGQVQDKFGSHLVTISSDSMGWLLGTVAGRGPILNYIYPCTLGGQRERATFWYAASCLYRAASWLAARIQGYLPQLILVRQPEHYGEPETCDFQEINFMVSGLHGCSLTGYLGHQDSKTLFIQVGQWYPAQPGVLAQQPEHYGLHG